MTMVGSGGRREEVQQLKKTIPGISLVQRDEQGLSYSHQATIDRVARLSGPAARTWQEAEDSATTEILAAADELGAKMETIKFMFHYMTANSTTAGQTEHLNSAPPLEEIGGIQKPSAPA